jgi:hypothetical protein
VSGAVAALRARRSLRLSGCALTVALALAAGCARQDPREVRAPSPPPAPAIPPVADSVTVGLWRFDERAGNSITDSAPFRLTGTAGPDTRVDFGRYRNARLFPATPQSFVHVPYNPVMESPRGFTVELWLYLNDISRYEMSALAMRWSPIANEQSWYLGVAGQAVATANQPSPGWFREVTIVSPPGRLVFAFRPESAAELQAFRSSTAVPTDRWVHVAASFDGEVVRLFLDGRLDTQVAVANGIIRSTAPLVVGNAIDPRRLTDFGGDLHQDPATAMLPFYALNGLVDELRLSNVARTSFESADLR